MLFNPDTALRLRKTPFTTLAASLELVVICNEKEEVWPLPTETLEEHTVLTRIQVSQPSGSPVISKLISSSIFALFVISTLKTCISPGPSKDSISKTSIMNSA